MARRNSPEWKRYESVATFLLDSLAIEFGLDRVESKQAVLGSSGTIWEIDAKGVTEDSTSIVVVECRLTKARQSQSKVGALAFVLQDTGANGGILVSPLPLQEGAKKVAAATNIVHVQLDAASTAEEFSLRFLNKLFIGTVAKVTASAVADVVATRVCRSCGTRFSLVANELLCPDCVNT